MGATCTKRNRKDIKCKQCKEWFKTERLYEKHLQDQGSAICLKSVTMNNQENNGASDPIEIETRVIKMESKFGK